MKFRLNWSKFCSMPLICLPGVAGLHQVGLVESHFLVRNPNHTQDSMILCPIYSQMRLPLVTVRCIIGWVIVVARCIQGDGCIVTSQCPLWCHFVWSVWVFMYECETSSHILQKKKVFYVTIGGPSEKNNNKRWSSPAHGGPKLFKWAVTNKWSQVVLPKFFQLA